MPRGHRSLADLRSFVSMPMDPGKRKPSLKSSPCWRPCPTSFLLFQLKFFFVLPEKSQLGPAHCVLSRYTMSTMFCWI
ncbi:hypothetical protein CCHR01_08205 [Colletotrichum chrysophilum]|uniref:Uncharacterized protein n=1 Tax=Colletotrichum chrysophilum TaxID=1836956 RepID=A0AAD9AK14_9PEZI|nr:hypothetical protein CCHR01_08205 [Colletotrichum chrysophilum]